MRRAQALIGLIVVLFGALLLLLTAGALSFSSLDIAAAALIISGVLFWIPGIVWRRTAPWVAFLFIPGALAFAVGAILMYTGRASASEWLYLWTILPVALGLAFLAVYDLAIRARWVRFTGIILTTVGLALLGFGMALFGADAITRTVGAMVLIAVGALVALRAAAPRQT